MPWSPRDQAGRWTIDTWRPSDHRRLGAAPTKATVGLSSAMNDETLAPVGDAAAWCRGPKVEEVDRPPRNTVGLGVMPHAAHRRDGTLGPVATRDPSSRGTKAVDQMEVPSCPRRRGRLGALALWELRTRGALVPRPQGPSRRAILDAAMNRGGLEPREMGDRGAMAPG
jgi:hypothetical protein